MTLAKIEERIAQLEQAQLKAGLAGVGEKELEAFLRQLETYNAALLSRQRMELFRKQEKQRQHEPYRGFKRVDLSTEQRLGEQLLSEGKVGCLILAGGQGTRLQMRAPKGTFPITLIKQKSLFQLFFERTLAASKRAGRLLPIAVMTSPANHQETENFLRENNWFGMPPAHVALFSQETLPFLDDRGNWLLETPAKLAAGPDGNGGALHCFYKSGVWEKWRGMGIEFLNIIPVDNPLADPFDAALCGHISSTKADAVLKCVQKESPEEQVGVVVETNGKLGVVEYSELSVEEKWVDVAAYTGMVCFAMRFVRQLAEDKQAILPWHFARKEADVLLGTSKGLFIEKAKIWKCETFLFDILAFTEKVEVLLYPREHCFAPLKNAMGEASVEKVREALAAYDRHVYSTIAHHIDSNRIFELDPAFYYPTPLLYQKWRGKSLPDVDYVEAD